MPSLRGLSDQKIADVLTYVRNRFANKKGPVIASLVKQVRENNQARKPPWNEEDLLKSRMNDKTMSSAKTK